MTDVMRSRLLRLLPRGGALAAIALAGAIALALLPSTASAAPQATTVSVETPDPASITFKARITSDADLTSAVVNYKVLSPDGDISGSVRAEVGGGRTADVSAQLQTSNDRLYLPVGRRITYTWTITDKSGATVTTPAQTFTFLDGRYRWQSKTEGLIAVYWYGESTANAETALRATVTSFAATEALLKVKVDYPVHVIVWRNTAEARAAQRPRSATLSQQTVLGGSRVAADVLHIYDPFQGFEDVALHEAAHIVTKIAGDGTFSQIPSWLDEGTAVHAQKDPGGYEIGVRRAVATDSLLRLRNMAGGANRADQTDLFYGESWAVVKFMIDTYGRDKFAAVFKSVKDGAPIDEALGKNIGVDQDGLYNAWRKSVGLKVIDFPPVPRATSIAGAQATQRPLGIPTSVTSAEDTAGGGGGVAGAASAALSRPATIVIGGGSVLVAAVLAFFALRLARKP